MHNTDFPISSEEDGLTARREFTKFLGLTSIAFAAGTFVAAARKIWRRFAADAQQVQIAQIDEIPIGGYKLFRYPSNEEPCILVRTSENKLSAFRQLCTHLSCPVIFDAKARQLECPCHKGFFSAEDGSVIAGPPKRPLESLRVSVEDGRVVVSHESIS
jgi:Rieske Fe-S protein